MCALGGATKARRYSAFFLILLQQLAVMDPQAVSSAVQVNLIPHLHLVCNVLSVLPKKEIEKCKFDDLGGYVMRHLFPIQLSRNCSFRKLVSMFM